MKKSKLIILFTLLHITLTFGQRNLIIDGRFDNATILEGETENKGEWFFLSVNDENSVKHAVGDEHQGTVAYFSTTKKTNIFKSFIGQVIQPTIGQGIYRVSFSAKTMSTDNNTEINLYVRIKTNDEGIKLYTLSGNDDYSSLPVYKTRLTNNWEYFTVDFDLSKYISIDNTDEPDQYQKFSPDESTLSDFYLAFSSLSPNAQIRFTDVSMSKIN